MKKKIIFIHGMFLNPKCWEYWISYFEALGYACEAPAWPLHEGEPSQLRANQPPGLGKLSLVDVYVHYQRIFKLESEPPICIGHSMGGLIMQKLAAEGLIKAGIGICPVAPNRMLAVDWGFIRNSASIANPFAGDEPFPMTPEAFRQNFANTLTDNQYLAAYERYAVDESRQVLRDVLGDEGVIDMDAPHAPLLMIGAEKDEIIPSSLVRRNAHAYSDPRSHSEFAEFTGRGHFICGEPGWEEVAAKISNWLEAHLHTERA
ncbi:MAG: alpha/beta hydrolase [Verrucomicrobiota bacterium]